MSAATLREVIEEWASFGLNEKGSNNRQNYWLSRYLLKPAEAAKLFSRVLEGDYVKDSSLLHLDSNCLVRVGLEYSPVIYVSTEAYWPEAYVADLKVLMRFDEFSRHQALSLRGPYVYRLWWD